MSFRLKRLVTLAVAGALLASAAVTMASAATGTDAQSTIQALRTPREP